MKRHLWFILQGLAEFYTLSLDITTECRGDFDFDFIFPSNGATVRRLGLKNSVYDIDSFTSGHSYAYWFRVGQRLVPLWYGLCPEHSRLGNRNCKENNTQRKLVGV